MCIGLHPYGLIISSGNQWCHKCCPIYPTAHVSSGHNHIFLHFMRNRKYFLKSSEGIYENESWMLYHHSPLLRFAFSNPGKGQSRGWYITWVPSGGERRDRNTINQPINHQIRGAAIGSICCDVSEVLGYARCQITMLSELDVKGYNNQIKKPQFHSIKMYKTALVQKSISQLLSVLWQENSCPVLNFNMICL